MHLGILTSNAERKPTVGLNGRITAAWPEVQGTYPTQGPKPPGTQESLQGWVRSPIPHTTPRFRGFLGCKGGLTKGISRKVQNPLLVSFVWTKCPLTWLVCVFLVRFAEPWPVGGQMMSQMVLLTTSLPPTVWPFSWSCFAITGFTYFPPFHTHSVPTIGFFLF